MGWQKKYKEKLRGYFLFLVGHDLSKPEFCHFRIPYTPLIPPSIAEHARRANSAERSPSVHRAMSAEHPPSIFGASQLFIPYILGIIGYTCT